MRHTSCKMEVSLLVLLLSSICCHLPPLPRKSYGPRFVIYFVECFVIFAKLCTSFSLHISIFGSLKRPLLSYLYLFNFRFG
jgi:hypothetical protein